jgi:hypothetical protein
MWLGGTMSLSPSDGEKKNTCPCRESNLGHPIHSQSLQRGCNINITHQQVGGQSHLFSQTRFPLPLHGIQKTNIWGGRDTRAKALDFWEMNLRNMQSLLKHVWAKCKIGKRNLRIIHHFLFSPRATTEAQQTYIYCITKLCCVKHYKHGDKV